MQHPSFSSIQAPKILQEHMTQAPQSKERQFTEFHRCIDKGMFH